MLPDDLDSRTVVLILALGTMLEQNSKGLKPEDIQAALDNRSEWMLEAVRQLAEDRTLDVSAQFQRLDEIIRIWLRGFDEGDKIPGDCQ